MKSHKDKVLLSQISDRLVLHQLNHKHDKEKEMDRQYNNELTPDISSGNVFKDRRTD